MPYDFNKGPHAPFKPGETPRAAWYLIEPVTTDPADHPLAEPAAGKQTRGKQTQKVLEIYDSEAFDAIRANFNLADWMGIGIPINRDHLHLRGGDSEAYGHVKALHDDDRGLWAYIAWLENGHELVDKGKYSFFSTEYPFEEFVYGDIDPESGLTTARPHVLYGLAITNYPANRRQDPMTRSQELTLTGFRCRTAAINQTQPQPPNPMNNKQKQKPTRARSEDAEFQATEEEKKQEEMQANNETADEMQDGIPDDGTTQANSENPDEDDTQANSDGVSFFADLLTKLGFDPNDTEVSEGDILAALDGIIAENNGLRGKLKENRQQLGGARGIASRLGFRARSEMPDGKAPTKTAQLQPGEMDHKTRSMADFVDNHVKTLRARSESLGQPWSMEKQSAAVRDGQNKYYRSHTK